MQLTVSVQVSKSRSSGVIFAKRVLVIAANFFHFAFRRWWRKPDKRNREDATSDISNSLSAKSRIIDPLSKLAPGSDNRYAGSATT